MYIDDTISIADHLNNSSVQYYSHGHQRDSHDWKTALNLRRVTKSLPDQSKLALLVSCSLPFSFPTVMIQLKARWDTTCTKVDSNGL